MQQMPDDYIRWVLSMSTYIEWNIRDLEPLSVPLSERRCGRRPGWRNPIVRCRLSRCSSRCCGDFWANFWKKKEIFPWRIELNWKCGRSDINVDVWECLRSWVEIWNLIRILNWRRCPGENVNRLLLKIQTLIDRVGIFSCFSWMVIRVIGQEKYQLIQPSVCCPSTFIM